MSGARSVMGAHAALDDRACASHFSVWTRFGAAGRSREGAACWRVLVAPDDGACASTQILQHSAKDCWIEGGRPVGCLVTTVAWSVASRTRHLDRLGELGESQQSRHGTSTCVASSVSLGTSAAQAFDTGWS